MGDNEMHILCIVVSVIVATAYYFLWPGWRDPERVGQRSLWSKIILRWFPLSHVGATGGSVLSTGDASRRLSRRRLSDIYPHAGA